MTYLNLNIDPEVLKIGTKDHKIKEWKNIKEEHDLEKILKSLKIDDDYYKKKYEKLKINELLLTIREVVNGSVPTKGPSTIAILDPSAVILILGSKTLLKSIAILVMNECLSNLKITYTKLRDLINVVTLLYEKTLKQSMVDKMIDDKEALELKNVYNHYLEKRSSFMKNTQFTVEDVFDDILSK